VAVLLHILDEVERTQEVIGTILNAYSIPLVTDDYNNWTVDIDWVLIAGVETLTAVDNHGVRLSSALHRHFTLPRAANLARLNVSGRRVEGDLINPGYAYQKITIVKPDLTEITLYEDTGDFGPGLDFLLNDVDITAHLDVAGTYELKLYGEVEVSWDYESGYIYDYSSVEYSDIALYVNSSLTVTKTLVTETTTPVDTIALYKFQADFTEQARIIEAFQIEVFTPPVALSQVIFVGTYGDHKIQTFHTGVAFGHFDTPEVDFGQPGMQKTLTEIQFETHISTPHTINVYVSVDGARTWIPIGQDSVSVGKTGFVHPWITAEHFIVRFYGTALHLFSYSLYAVPSGSHIRIS